MPEFVKDLEELRRRAISKIEEGPVTTAYQLDKNETVTILNEALATEIVCVLRYMHHYFMATGVHGKGVADEFKEHADAERNHADALAQRIQQLGGKPDYNPGSLVQRSASQYIEGETLGDMIREDLIAERVVIELYTDMIRHFGDKDPTTRVLLEGLLADEEEHAADLADLLYIVDPRTGETEGEDPGTHPLDMKGGGREHGQRKPGVGGSERMGGRRGSQNEEASMRDRTGNQGQSGTEGTRGEGARTGQPRAEVGLPPQGSEQFAGRGTATDRAEAEMRAARSEGRGRTEDSVPPEHAPGTTGHPTRQRGPAADEIEPGEPAYEAEEGAQSGTTRAVHVTRPTRKKRIA